MTTHILRRDTPNANNVQNRIQLLKDAQNAYHITKKHLERYVRSRLELERQGKFSGEQHEVWLGSEKEMIDALEVYRSNILILTNELENQKVELKSKLSHIEYSEYLSVVKNVQNEKVEPDTEPRGGDSLPIAESGYQIGLAHGNSDGVKKKRRNYRPSLLKALLSDQYRKEYIRGYNDGFREIQRQSRRAELKLLNHRRHAPSKDLER